LYLAAVFRPFVLAVLVFALGTAHAEAAAQQLPIVVVPGLELEDLRALAAHGAVGLLIPANGPTTSGAQARAALARGELQSAFVDGGVPDALPLVIFETAAAPPAGPAIVLGLPSGGEQPNDRGFPIAVLGNGFEGLLTSQSTRLPGVVSIADVAPTALGEDDGLRSTAAEDPVARVLALDRLIEAKKDARLVSGLLVAGLILLLALGFPRAALLAFATALTANLVLGVAETATLWIVVVVMVAALAAAVPLARVLRSAVAVGLALAAVLVLYLVAFALDGSWVAYSPWGPPQNGRFYGVSNLLETMLLVPALAGAALVARRFGAVAFAAVAAVAFVAVAGSRFGADGGGALVLAAGYAILAALLAGLRGRALVFALAGAAALAGALIALDAATGGSSHVTRAIGGGPESLASHFGDRLVISWERATVGPGAALFVFVPLVVLAILAVRVAISEAPMSRRALPLGFAAAIAVSLVVNDSPNDVATAGLVGFVVCGAVMLRARCAAASCLRSPSAFSWPAAVERPPWRPRPRP
jgi:hypothetical protein